MARVGATDDFYLEPLKMPFKMAIGPVRMTIGYGLMTMMMMPHVILNKK